MKTLNWIIRICRILVGLTFIFSGFVKAVDPIGSMIKFDEYFEAFHTVFFQRFSLFFAIALASLEFILGFALIFASKMKMVGWLSLLLMGFFTIQTFILAIWSPVTDCGCFGDAIKLTNWQTFYKNLVLIAIVIIVFSYRKKIYPLFPKYEWLVIIFGALIVITVSLYSWLYMPLIDFRPYRVGNDIKELMTIPKGKHGDIIKTILIYKNTKTGEIKEFPDDNLPTDYVLWEYKDRKDKLVEKGFVPPTKDFRFSNLQGLEMNDSFFNVKGIKILIIQEKLGASNTNAQQKLNELVRDIQKEGKIKFWALTSSLETEMFQYIKKNNVPYTFYTADGTLLKTMDRSNPAVILFKDNVVIRHWPARGIPGYQKLLKCIK